MAFTGYLRRSRPTPCAAQRPSATGGSNHMTKKTRIRIARVAAGAVIAAGASLTAAGAASALDIGVSLDQKGVSAKVDLFGNGDGSGNPDPIPSDTGIPTDPGNPPTDPGNP